MDAFLGVDVGTGSVRAALFNGHGQVVGRPVVVPIQIHKPQQDFYEQSSQEIWAAVCASVRQVVAADKGTHKVRGIGFDATCSMVVVPANPLDLEWDVIMWMDHRAKAETAFINGLAHPVLDYVGAKVSLEMQTPKLLWLKKNKSQQWWQDTQAFFDLSDYLTFKATGGSKTRSLCSLVCKWTYRGRADDKGPAGWDPSYFQQIGLCSDHGDSQGLFAKMGQRVLNPGEKVGTLGQQAAQDMGLDTEVIVACSLIDAHAGALGLLATRHIEDIESTLCLISGTSACHMILNKRKLSIPGVWGPYYSAILADYWLHEGGQSAVGALIDHLLQSHPAFNEIKSQDIYLSLEGKCKEMAKKKELDSIHKLTRDFHVLPDFHGNRSPLADPEMKGMITGLQLDKSVESLALLYLSVIQAVAYGTKMIVEQLVKHGHSIKQVAICGGLSKSDLYVQTTSDVLGLRVIKPHESESVLLGSAILAKAAQSGTSLEVALQSMQGQGRIYAPDPSIKSYHGQKYAVFLELVNDQAKYRQLMSQ